MDLWLSDERCVPPDHEQSNSRLVERVLIDPLPEEGRPVFHRMRGELGPQDGANAYEEELRAAGPADDDPPAFELILIGLGPDAHTCSLFPNDAALGVRDRWVVGVETPGMAPLVPRITLTLPVVNAGRRVVFLVTGEDKADAVARAFSGHPDPRSPGSLVEGSPVVLLDQAAAARL